jgi:hypothetical protein
MSKETVTTFFFSELDSLNFAPIPADDSFWVSRAFKIDA